MIKNLILFITELIEKPERKEIMVNTKKKMIMYNLERISNPLPVYTNKIFKKYADLIDQKVYLEYGNDIATIKVVGKLIKDIDEEKSDTNRQRIWWDPPRDGKCLHIIYQVTRTEFSPLRLNPPDIRILRKATETEIIFWKLEKEDVEPKGMARTW